MLILPVLMLVGCEGKPEPKEIFEAKIDGEIQKLNDDTILKLMKYKNSICKISDWFSQTIDETTVGTTVVINNSSTLTFNLKELKVILDKLVLDQNGEFVNNNDINSFEEMFLALEEIKKNWGSAEVYTSDTATFDNLKNFKEYSFNKMHLERDKVVCEFHLLTKN